MSESNLHRDEAAERARLVTVESTTVRLDLTAGPVTFGSSSIIRFACSEPGATTFADLVATSVRDVVLNGERLEPSAVFSDGRLRLPRLAAENELRVVAVCAYTHTGEGLHRFVDPVDDAVYLYSQFETFDAHRMYACFDQPDLKTEFDLTVTAPAGWTVVSNYPTLGEPERIAEDVRCWRFVRTPPLSPYVTAVVAGPYHGVYSEYQGAKAVIPLGVFCRASLSQHLDAEEIFAVTRAGFEFYEREFDYPYPFEKYDQLFVPEFNAGAMENAGCVTFLEEYVFRSKEIDYYYQRRGETILHELAHMWFGDLVTMRWWDDLWLNESFATYVSALCQAESTRWTDTWTTFANIEKVWALKQDQLPSTHPIAADTPDISSVEVNFDGITYGKGASVLKQLVAWVGREEFFAGMRTYFQRHAWGNTSLHDLLTVLEESSHRDLHAWSKEWLQSAGVNTLRAVFDTAPDGDGEVYTAFAIEQTAPPGYPTLRSHRLAVGLYDRTPAGFVRRDCIDLDVVGASTEVPALVGVRRPDVLLPNDGDHTYAKIRLDAGSLAALTPAVNLFEDSLTRALCWSAAWDMTRDDELPARDYVSMVLAGASGERDVGVVATLLRQLRFALDNYVEPARRDTEMRRASEVLRAWAWAAAPGSDHQLAFTRGFSSTVTRPDHVAVLQHILDGTDAPPGLAVDTELRWHLLTRLTALGGAGDAEIDAELERDRTATGERHVVTARAARPTPEAKAVAWRSLVETAELPYLRIVAILAGFQSREHPELLTPYIEPYFAAVESLWEERMSEMAQALVVGLYPIVDRARVVDRTDAFLAERTLPSALRRLLVESRDEAARALRAQKTDRELAAGG